MKRWLLLFHVMFDRMSTNRHPLLLPSSVYLLHFPSPRPSYVFLLLILLVVLLLILPRLLPLRKDSAYSIHSVYDCLAPNAEGVEERHHDQHHTPEFPHTWQSTKTARKVKRLVTEKDAMRLKVYTSAIMRRARIEKQVRGSSSQSTHVFHS